ncbi:MAG: hypothetical protein OQK76_04590, partial [Gammaproteobacteria bacterium]|nr:hypothetical protein [Gammaproteobacteria bacterium]
MENNISSIDDEFQNSHQSDDSLLDIENSTENNEDSTEFTNNTITNDDAQIDISEDSYLEKPTIESHENDSLSDTDPDEFSLMDQINSDNNENETNIEDQLKDIPGDQHLESQYALTDEIEYERHTDDITSESITQNSLNNDSDNETGIEDLIKDILGDQYEESQPVQSEDNNAEINTDDITSESISQNSLNNDSDNETGIEDLLKDILGDQYQENQSTHTDKRQSITSIDQIIAEANDQITPLDETQTDQALTNNDEYEYSFSYKNISNSKLDQNIFQVEKLWDELSNSWPVIYNQPEIKLKIEKLWQSLKRDDNGNVDIYSFSNDAIDNLLNEIDTPESLLNNTHDDSTSSEITEEHNEKEDNYLTETDSTTQDEDNELSDNSTHEYSHLIDSENHKLTEPYLTTHQELYTDNHDEAEAGIEETETSSGELEDQKEESDERLSQSILNNENNIDYQLYSKTNEDHKLIANSTIESIEETESELDNLEKTDFDAEIISNESENFPSEEDLGTLNLINTYYTETDDKTTDTQTLINTESEENKTTSTIGRGTESVEDKIIDQEIAIEERFESSAIDNDDFDEKITLSKIPIPDYTTTLDKNSTHTQDNLKSKKHPTRVKPK